jgi:hypothetical protein
MKGIPETNRLTVSVSDEGYSRNQSFDFEPAHSQTIGFRNTLHQIRSKSNDWFLEYPSSDMLTVKRLVSGIPFIRYAHSQTIGFWNTFHQIRSQSNDWFLEYPSSDTLTVKRLVSGIPFIRYAQSQTIGERI